MHPTIAPFRDAESRWVKGARRALAAVVVGSTVAVALTACSGGGVRVEAAEFGGFNATSLDWKITCSEHAVTATAERDGAPVTLSIAAEGTLPAQASLILGDPEQPSGPDNPEVIAFLGWQLSPSNDNNGVVIDTFAFDPDGVSEATGTAPYPHPGSGGDGKPFTLRVNCGG